MSLETASTMQVISGKELEKALLTFSMKFYVTWYLLFTLFSTIQ